MIKTLKCDYNNFPDPKPTSDPKPPITDDPIIKGDPQGM